jgi:osmotically-inducible protein OsmY
MTTSLLAVTANVSAADPSSARTDSTSRKQAHANNRALSHAVRQSLTKAKELDSSHINVLARGKTVTLTGSAPDRSQIETAQTVAADVAGVGRVDNRLTVAEAGN